MNITRPAAALLLATMACPAIAQDPVELYSGVAVYGPAGEPVGTIVQVSGNSVLLDTGSNVATLTRTSFVKGSKGPTIGFSKPQLDEAINRTRADQESRLAATLVEGARLRSRDGIEVGTVKRIEADGSVVVADDEKAFRLERSQLSTDSQGLILLFTASQLKAALKEASGDY